MNNKQSLLLIDGHFSTEESNEILMNIFSTKIQFHEVKNFSSQERFGKKDEISIKRIPELKNEIKKLQEIIAEARLNNKKLIINSEINISISDE